MNKLNIVYRVILYKMLHYFLTIDRSRSDRRPTIEDYEEIIREFQKQGIICSKPIHIVYEYKTKVMCKEIAFDWIHCHAIVVSKSMVKFNGVQVKNYSVKFKYLKDKDDVLRTAIYMHKNCTDQVRLSNDRKGEK